MERTLFVSDLDGTLLDSTSRLSGNTERMLNEAIAGGAMFSIATARTPATVSTILANVRTKLPVVVMTGSVLWDPATGEFMNPKFHDPAVAVALRDTLRRHSVPFFQYTLDGGHIHVYHEGPLSELEWRFVAERSGTPFKTFHIAPRAEGGTCAPIPERNDNILLFYALQPKVKASAAYSELKGTEGVNVMFYEDIFGPEISNLEIFPEAASKASAVKELAGMVGADRIVAYGDNYNDLPLFRIADEAVCVENAVEELRRAATRRIGPNTSDSVAGDILIHTQMK